MEGIVQQQASIKMSLLSKNNRVQSVSLFILAIAAILKIWVYFRNRSLFLDDLNLSRNIVESSYLDLISQLNYEQFAPPLFCHILKGCTAVFGVTEYSLRLFPLLAGLVSLYLFYRLAERFIKNPVILYPLILFSFSDYMLRHNTEVKQYSSDVLCTLLFLWLALHVDLKKKKHWIGIMVLGIILLWLSMPLAFVLAGVGVYFAYGLLPKNTGLSVALVKENAVPLQKIVLMGTLWLSSFLVLYLVNLRHSISIPSLQAFHANHFLAFPTSIADVQQSGEVLIGLIRNVVGKTAIPILWGVLCFFLGVYTLFKKNVAEALLLLTPIIACLFAALFHQYSLIVRLSLFMLPIFALIIGVGAAFLFEKAVLLSKPRKQLGILTMVVLMTLSLEYRSALPYFYKEFEIEAPRPSLEKLAAHDENHYPLYLVQGGIPAYEFYTKLYRDKLSIPSEEVYYGKWDDQLPPLAEEWKKKGIKKIWLFNSHTYGESLQTLNREIEQIGRVITKLESQTSFAVLLELKLSNER